MIDIDRIKQIKAKELRETANNLIKLFPRDEIIIKLEASRIKLGNPPDDIIQKLIKWEEAQNSVFLYYFVLHRNTDLKIIQEKITETKNNKIAGRAYPRINSASRFLYVGSSREITKRFKEHLGYGYKGTYAMNLAYWFNDLGTGLKFHCMSFDPDTNKDAIQALEDGLWDYLKPQLGRRGPK
jgi:hypothetical protein